MTSPFLDLDERRRRRELLTLPVPRHHDSLCATSGVLVGGRARIRQHAHTCHGRGTVTQPQPAAARAG